MERPDKALKAFKRVAIAPGETQTVTLTFTGHDLAYWHTSKQAWVVEEGDIQVMVGSSSADQDLLLRKTIAVSM
ncbi:MAG: fibronectin type III-like domain-contianing protein [Chloroflexota bacterium]